MWAAALFLLGAAASLTTEPAREDGLQAAAAVSISQVYDDELATPSPTPVDALLTRLSPQLLLGYRAPRLSLIGFGTFDAELPDANPRLGSPWARGNASLDLNALLSERLTLTATALYVNTTTPNDVALGPAFDPGRVDLQSFQANAGLDYRLTERLDAVLTSELLRTDELGLDTDMVTVQPEVRNLFTPRDTGLLRLLVRETFFDDTLTINTLAPVAGWTRKLTPMLGVTLEAGPRFDNGVLEGLEALATAQLDLQHLSGTFSFASTQAPVPGLIGMVDSDSFSATARYRWVGDVMLGANASVFVSHGAPLEDRTVQLGLEAWYPLTSSIALSASYRHAWQQVTEVSNAAFFSIPTEPNQALLTLSFGLSLPPAQPPPQAPGEGPEPETAPEEP